MAAPAEPLELSGPAGTLVEAAFDGGLLRPVEGRLKAPGEGEHWLALVSRNAVGALSDVRWVRVVVDGEAPLCRISVSPPPVEHPQGVAWVRPGTVVLLEAEDAVAGVASVDLSVGSSGGASGVSRASWTVEEEGRTAVRGRCVDAVGNRAEATAVEFGVDGTAPVGELSLDGPWVPVEEGIVAAPSALVRASWKDGLSGVAAARVAADGVWREGESLPGGWTEGRHVVEATARDWAGNESAPISIGFVVDGTPPSLDCRAGSGEAGSGGAARWVRRGSRATCEAKDAVAGVAAVEWSTDGSSWHPAGGGVPLEGGGVRVRARDGVGNVREQELPLRVDGTAPDLSIGEVAGGNAGGPGSMVLGRGGSLTIAVHDGESGVAEAEYRVGSGPWSPLHGPVIFRDTGTFVVEVRAVDRTGNRAVGRWSIRVEPGTAGRR